MKKIYTLFVFFAAAALYFSCQTSRKKPGVSFAEYLALRDDLTSPQEAVVWTLSPDGNVETFWIKNDVTGILVTARRADWVLPTENGLWRLENDETEKDYDLLEFRDLVSGEMLQIPLEEHVGNADAGVEDTETSSDGCTQRTIQGRPLPLISVGSYVFIKYEEKTYDCGDNPILNEEKFVTVDLATKEKVVILNDKEREAIFEKDNVKILAKEGEVRWDGTIPAYNPAFMLTFVHVFSTVRAEISEDGSTHSVINKLEVSDTRIPEKLAQYYVPPELVQTFGMSVPDVTLGGFVGVGGAPEVLMQQFNAFSSLGDSAQ